MNIESHRDPRCRQSNGRHDSLGVSLDDYRNELWLAVNRHRRLNIPPSPRALRAGINSTASGSVFREYSYRVGVATWAILGLIVVAARVTRNGRRRVGAERLGVCIFESQRRFLPADVTQIQPAVHRIARTRMTHPLEYFSLVSGMMLVLAAVRVSLAIRRQFPRSGRIGSACRAVNLGWSKCLDAIALETLLRDNPGISIATAGQYDWAVSLVSRLREELVVRDFSGYQHGLFEFPPGNCRIRKIAFDSYLARFAESTRYIREYFISNPDCRIDVSNDSKPPDWAVHPQGDRAILIGFAFQADNVERDCQIVEWLREVCNSTGATVVAYLHPSLSRNQRQKIDQRLCGLETHERTRHRNLALMVTRYSTMGLDYSSIGVPVAFIPYPDNVCALMNRQSAHMRSRRDLDKCVLGVISRARKERSSDLVSK